MQTKHLCVLIHIWAKGTSGGSSGAVLFVDHFSYLCFVFVLFSCLFIAATWSPVVKGLTYWLF